MELRASRGVRRISSQEEAHTQTHKLRIAVERVDRDGRLAEGWTVKTATDWVWARNHLTTWQHLVGERGWAPNDYKKRSISSILAEILAPASDESAPTLYAGRRRKEMHR